MLRSKKTTIVSGVIVITVLLVAGFMRQQYVVPIIMYHSVNPRVEDRLTVSAKTFERQMAFLKRNHYNVLSLQELVNLIKEKKKIPHHTIAITIDDGYKDNYDYAFPILKKYNLPAAIFIIINEVGWPNRLNWNEIKIMDEGGIITFGSHTLDHPYLPDVESYEELKRQIFDSKKILEEKLGEKVNMFCYPTGGFNARVRQLVIDAGYKAAVALKSTGRYPASDVFSLRRIKVSEQDNNLLLFWIKISGFYNIFREAKYK